MDDELRVILGDKIFDELSSLGDEFDGWDVSSMSPEILERLADTHFVAKVPMTGDEALVLVAAFVHLIETGCDNCRGHVEEFAANFITTLWELVQQVYADMENGHE